MTDRIFNSKRQVNQGKIIDSPKYKIPSIPNYIIQRQNSNKIVITNAETHEIQIINNKNAGYQFNIDLEKNDDVFGYTLTIIQKVNDPSYLRWRFEQLLNSDEPKITKIYIQNCSEDVIHLIQCPWENQSFYNRWKNRKNILRYQSTIQLVQLDISDSLINIFKLKQFLQNHIHTLQVVTLHNVKLYTANQYTNLTNDQQQQKGWLKSMQNFFKLNIQPISRGSAIRYIFLQDTLRPVNIPNLQSLTVSIEPIKQITENKWKKREYINYQNVIEELQDEVNAHIKLSQNIIYNDDSTEVAIGYIIDSNTFISRKALEYSLNFMQQNSETLKKLYFANLTRPKENVFKLVFNVLRQLTKITHISFINVPLQQEHLKIIKNLFWWFRNEIEEIEFIQNGLVLEDLHFLFNKKNLKIQEFSNLRNLKIDNYKNVFQESQLYTNLMKYIKQNMDKYQMKLEKKSKTINNLKTLNKNNQLDTSNSKNLNTQNEQINNINQIELNTMQLNNFNIDKQLKQKRFRQIIYRHSFIQQREDLLKAVLDKYLVLDSNEELDLSDFQLYNCSKQTQIQLIKYISESKTLRHVSLSNVIMDDVFAQKLSLSMKKNSKYLQYLDLSGNNQIGPEILENFLQVITRFCKHFVFRDIIMTQQKFLKIKKCLDFESQEHKSMDQMFQFMQILDMSNVDLSKINSINQLQEFYVMLILAGSNKEKILNLSSCILTALQQQAFLHALEQVNINQQINKKESINIKSINLSDNQLNSQFLVSILSKIFQHFSNSLTIINLSGSSSPCQDDQKIEELMKLISNFSKEKNKPNLCNLEQFNINLQRSSFNKSLEISLMNSPQLQGKLSLSLPGMLHTIFYSCNIKQLILKGYSYDSKFIDTNDDNQSDVFLLDNQIQHQKFLRQDKELKNVRKGTFLTNSLITELSSHFYRFSEKQVKLQYLDISNNDQLDDPVAFSKLILSVLKTFRLTIKNINISGSKLKSMLTNKTAKSLTQTFLQQSKSDQFRPINLHFVNIARNTNLDALVLSELVESIFLLSNQITILDLSGQEECSMLDSSNALAIAKVLNKRKKYNDQNNLSSITQNLINLDISQNISMDPNSLKELLFSFLNSGCKLQKIAMAGSQKQIMLSSQKSESLIELFIEMRVELQWLEVFDISRNSSLSAEDLALLIQTVIDVAPNLKQLVLQGNFNNFSMLDDEKINAISRIIASYAGNRLHNFEEIDISLNVFSAATFTTLEHSLLETSIVSSSYKKTHARSQQDRLASSANTMLRCNNLSLDDIFIRYGGRRLELLTELIINEIALIPQNQLIALLQSVLEASFNTIRKIGLVGNEGCFALDDQRVEQIGNIFENFNRSRNSLPEFIEFDISKNSISERALQGLLYSVFDSSKTGIKILSLAGTKDYSMITNSKVGGLLNFFLNYQQNKKIDENPNNNLKSESIQKLHISLETIDLSQNSQLSEQNLIKLLQSLIGSCYSTLHSIKLQGNVINNSNVNKVAKFFESVDASKQLKLQDIDISLSSLTWTSINTLKMAVLNACCESYRQSFTIKSDYELEQKSNNLTIVNSSCSLNLVKQCQDIVLDNKYINQNEGNLQNILLKFHCDLKSISQKNKGVHLIIQKNALDSLPSLAYCLPNIQDFQVYQIESIFYNLDTLIIDQLFMNFIYGLCPIRPGRDYLHSIILQPSFYTLMNKSTLIQQKSQRIQNNAINLKSIIFPSSTIMPGFSFIKDPKYIDSIYSGLKDSSIKTILMEYEVQCDTSSELCKVNNQVNKIFVGANAYSEKELLERLIFLPPASTIINGQLCTINFLKALYSICYENPHFQLCQMQYQSSSTINNGIAVALSEKSYEMGDEQIGCFGRICKYFFFYFFDLLSGSEQIYKMDDQVIQLNEEINETFLFLKLKNWLIFLFLIYYLIAFLPLINIIISNKQQEDNDRNQDLQQQQCISGIADLAYYSYTVFAISTFFIEIYFFKFILRYVSHLLPGISITPSPSKIVKLINGIKISIMNITLFNYKIVMYAIDLLFSQIARYDLFSDMGFLAICFQCNEIYLGIASASVLAILMTTNIIECLLFIFRKPQNRTMNTHNLNEFFEAVSIIEFHAIGEILDIVSPYNVMHIPTKSFQIWSKQVLLFGSLSGATFSNKILRFFLRFIVEDVPQIIFQIIFIFKRYQIDQETNRLVLFSLISNIISFFITFYKFLTVRPSIITQIDFDELADKKQIQFPQYWDNMKNLHDEKMATEIIKACFNGIPVKHEFSSQQLQQQSQNKIKVSNQLNTISFADSVFMINQ